MQIFNLKSGKNLESNLELNVIDFQFRLEGVHLLEDVVASGATGFGTSERVVEVPEDPDFDEWREEAERRKKGEAHITSQSDRSVKILVNIKVFLNYFVTGFYE